jgi:protease inhibitor Inh
MTRPLACLFLAMMVAGCAGGSLTSGGAGPTTGELGMPGRWILAAPNAPTCGMNFTGARSGKVSPEGGCPGNFYLSRTWALENDALVIKDEGDNTIARLPNAGGQFEGQSAAGLSVTLSRPAAPPPPQ